MNRPWPFRQDLGLSGSALRRLRTLREQVKVVSARLPRALLHELLAILEGARPWQVRPLPIPEMTRPELLRAIRWRLGTIPLAGAEAAAAFVTRHRRPQAPARPRAAASGRRTR